jgi:hypothetical protein
MRILLDGNWTTMEFAEFFSTLSAMYFAPLPPGQVKMEWRSDGSPLEWTTEGSPLTWAHNVSPSEDFWVIQVRFASPGFTDLAGLAALLREIRIFIQYLCERRARINLMDIEYESRKLRVEAMKKLIYDDGDRSLSQRLMPFLTQDESPVLDLIYQKKITGAVDSDGDSE